MSHIVTIRFDGYGYHPSYSMTCTQPTESMCHADWDCCEYFDDCGDEGGRPWHERGYGERSVERHYGTYDPTRCNICDWFENTEDIHEYIKGAVSFNVASEWGGDYYEWRVMGGEQA